MRSINLLFAYFAYSFDTYTDVVLKAMRIIKATLKRYLWWRCQWRRRFRI